MSSTTHGRDGVTVFVCQGTGCASSRSDDIRLALAAEVEHHGIADRVSVELSGCHGFCQQGPVVTVEPEGIFYRGVKPAHASTIVEEHLLAGEPVGKLLYRQPGSKEPVPHYRDVLFYREQTRLILRNCGRINPERIEQYEAAGGYKGLARALGDMAPDDVVEEVRQAGLRGRGGAGFPAARKWAVCAAADGDKYVICNADEGDPGAFQDGYILEADPHAVLEGLTLLGYAVGARKGYVYCRSEYPLALHRLRIALDQSRERGMLGADILGSGFDFEIEIFEGAGAFVCGEETALIKSIEGRRGMPRTRPPYPAEVGLWGRPTIINNVKSLASVTAILTFGWERFRELGTDGSPGTAVFALTGKVTNSGLVEVPMGTPLTHIVETIGGGVPKGKSIKAIQTGGPSGGCLPARLLDMPVDFDSLTEAGSMMGSGGLVVMDEDTCMVDVARFFLTFTQSESCGKCTPCRVGTRHLVDLLEKICRGEGTLDDLDSLESLAKLVKEGSLCGLGQTAPNPVLTALRHFRSEFMAHVLDKRCPAVVCRDLITFRIIPERCTGCQRCVRACPTEAITGPRSEPHNLDQSLCIQCRSCYEVCRFDAVAGDAIILVS